MTTADLEHISALAAEAAARVDCELVEAALVNEGHGWTLRVLVDRAEGAALEGLSRVSLEDCRAVSKALSAVLDVNDPLPFAYRLEVSSPGVDRPLKKLADYARFAGKLAVIKCQREVEGRKRFKGRLRGVEGEEVLLEVDTGLVRLPFAGIAKANLEFEFPVKTKP